MISSSYIRLLNKDESNTIFFALKQITGLVFVSFKLYKFRSVLLMWKFWISDTYIFHLFLVFFSLKVNSFYLKLSFIKRENGIITYFPHGDFVLFYFNFKKCHHNFITLNCSNTQTQVCEKATVFREKWLKYDKIGLPSTTFIHVTRLETNS